MKNVLGGVTTLDDTFLDSIRQLGDPPADAVARDLCNSPRGPSGRPQAVDLVATLIKSSQMWDDDGQPSRRLPEDIRLYLIQSRTLPSWRNQDAIDRAEAFFLLNGFASSTLLACASLPECYVMKYGTEVLAFTKFLQADPTRRIRETAQMVMSVMSPGGLTRRNGGAPGVNATQKVRVMHAIIRQMVASHPGSAANPTDPELRAKFGMPINQEDLVYTLMTFSYVVIRGFGRLGLWVSEAERNAYVHCWNVVGVLMGIRDDLLPATYEDAKQLFLTIQRRQHGASAAGQSLTRALLTVLEAPMPRRFTLLPAVLTRELVGDATADALGIQKGPLFDRAFLWVVLRIWAAGAFTLSSLNANRPFQLTSEYLHRRIMLAIGRLQNTTFQIPPEFVEQWFPGEGLPDTKAEAAGT